MMNQRNGKFESIQKGVIIMKRYIKSVSSPYENTYSFEHGPNKKFLAQWNDSDNIIRNGQVTAIHPYDDAEYAWAKIDGPKVTFIKDGKVLDHMTIADYDEDWWDDGNGGGYDAYISDVFDTIAVELLNFNRDVKPIMVHN